MPCCSMLQQSPVGAWSKLQCCHTCRNPLWHQMWSCSEEYSSSACSRDGLTLVCHVLVENTETMEEVRPVRGQQQDSPRGVLQRSSTAACCLLHSWS